jgi:hypothetical protein
VGDVLVLSNFVNGGGSSNIQVYKVSLVNTGKGKAKCPTGSVEDSALAGQICTQLLVSGTAGLNGVCNEPDETACAATNGIIVPSLDPAFTPKSGATTGNYPVVGFFEGGVDLTALGLGGECFSSFMVETRSSQSITAVLKDFTLGKFENCVASIETGIFKKNASPPDTEVTDQSVTPGTVIYDVATVSSASVGITNDPGSGGTGNCTTGTRDCKVVFKLFSNTTDASGNPVGCQTANLITTYPGALCVSDGPGSGSCTAQSPDFTTQVPPGYSYLATYNGDSNNPPVALPQAACEIVLVGKLDATVATDIFRVTSAGPPVVLGDKITDNAKLVDLNGSATVPVIDQATVSPKTSGPTPTGTVSFTRFADGACGGTGTTETISLSSGVALSSIFNLGANGLSYRATYSGDSVYNGTTIGRCEPVCAIDTSVLFTQ